MLEQLHHMWTVQPNIALAHLCWSNKHLIWLRRSNLLGNGHGMDCLMWERPVLSYLSYTCCSCSPISAHSSLQVSQLAPLSHSCKFWQGHRHQIHILKTFVKVLSYILLILFTLNILHKVPENYPCAEAEALEYREWSASDHYMQPGFSLVLLITYYLIIAAGVYLVLCRTIFTAGLGFWAQ